MTHYNLCDSCETVAHCLKHGCVPLQSVDWEAVAADQAMTIALLKAEQPAQQEPVARLKGVDEYGPMLDWYKHWVSAPIGTKFYTSPRAQRKPLTSEQIEKLCPQFEDPMRREMWIIGFKAAHNIKD